MFFTTSFCRVHVCLSLILLMTSGIAEAQTSIFDEEFDDDGNGSRYTLSVQFNGHPAGYFDVATDPTLAEDGSYINIDGILSSASIASS